MKADEQEPVLSIIVPVYNEEATLQALADRLRGTRFGVPVETIFVNDGSRDRSTAILDGLSGPGLRVFHRPANGGKGAAVGSGLELARGRFVVVQDADLELDPSEIFSLYEAAAARPGSACYGSRFLGDNRRYHGMPTYWANRLLTLLCNLLSGVWLSDMNTCYKLMPLEVARRLKLESQGFAMEPEITIKLARMGVPVQERPVSYTPRDTRAGKKIRASDFFRYLRAMAKFRLVPLDTNPGAASSSPAAAPAPSDSAASKGARSSGA